MNDAQFSQLLDFFSFSWAGYRKVRKGVKKRIARHMTALVCRDMDAYLGRLQWDPAAKNECECLLTVPISRFFRDRRLWDILPEQILPRFFDQKRLRVWSAGCSGGEEVYSFKIIWEMHKIKAPDLPDLELAGCDLKPENLDRARKGVYPLSSLRETGKEIRDRFFEKGPSRKTLAVRPYLKQGICWEVYDLLDDQPAAEKYDVIFLRNNILTYTAADRKLDGFNNVISALADSGILVIGAKEHLPEGVSGIEPLEPAFVFQKKSPAGEFVETASSRK